MRDTHGEGVEEVEEVETRSLPEHRTTIGLETKVCQSTSMPREEGDSMEARKKKKKKRVSTQTSRCATQTDHENGRSPCPSWPRPPRGCHNN